MTRERIDALIDRVRSWPKERQALAAEILLLLETQESGPLRLTDDEWAAIQEGNAQAERGEFVDEEEIAAFNKRHGL